MRNSLPVLIFLILLSCKEIPNQTSEEIQESVLSSYTEPYRPQFHFSPPEKWMNDPNGLVYHKGIYHLFYQYYPDSIVWGPMHWGHATSRDLVEWEHKPIALYPDDLGYIFSGSAVVDTKNTSGFGTVDNPPLVAIYTYHDSNGEQMGTDTFQTQGIAYSLDSGDTWAKYEGNPVIGNDGIRDFRDPKVFWHEEGQQWVMALVAGDHTKFYGSSNLKAWQLLSEFGKNKGAHGGVWECPDLFRMKVEGTNQEKWVLLVSINPGAPNGGSGTQYFVGDFDGTTFITDQIENKWIDLGRDNYAGVTYNNVPTGERIFVGWMSNWDYAQKTPTKVWRSSMTLPRTLSLHKEEGEYYLRSYPIEAISKLVSESVSHPSYNLEIPLNLGDDDLMQSELSFYADLSKELVVVLSNASEKITFEVDPKQAELRFDRRASGQTNFEERFAGTIQKQSYQPVSGNTEVRMFLDASSVEIFVDKGRYVFTNQIFPSQPYNELTIKGASNAKLELTEFNFNQLNSIWNNE